MSATMGDGASGSAPSTPIKMREFTPVQPDEMEDLVLDEEAMDTLYLKVYTGQLSRPSTPAKDGGQDAAGGTAAAGISTPSTSLTTPSSTPFKLPITPASQGKGGANSKRYYIEDQTICYNCGGKGHFAGECIEAKNTVPVCRLCEEVGHATYACPKTLICHACNMAGHIARECPNPRCHRCGEIGHKMRDCRAKRPRDSYDDRSRSEDLGSSESAEVLDFVVSVRNDKKRTFCYNCGSGEHLGAKCPLSTIDKLRVPYRKPVREREATGVWLSVPYDSLRMTREITRKGLTIEKKILRLIAARHAPKEAAEGIIPMTAEDLRKERQRKKKMEKKKRKLGNDVKEAEVEGRPSKRLRSSDQGSSEEGQVELVKIDDETSLLQKMKRKTQRVFELLGIGQGEESTEGEKTKKKKKKKEKKEKKSKSKKNENDDDSWRVVVIDSPEAPPSIDGKEGKKKKKKSSKDEKAKKAKKNDTPEDAIVID